jgi:glucosamine-6-phosphate deaminase
MEPIAESLGASLISRYPPTILCKNSNAVAKTYAGIICDTLERKPNALICLPAGEPAKETYEELIRRVRSGKVNFERAHFVQLDEWLDLDDESENCTAFMQHNFYGPAGINRNRFLFLISTTRIRRPPAAVWTAISVMPDLSILCCWALG